MDEQMMKSLVQLIDESLAEIEELKKSDRFSAQEIKLEGAGGDLAGKPTNGSLDKADEECDDKDEDEKKDKKAIEKKVDEHNEKKHGEDKDEDSAMEKADCDEDEDDEDEKKKKMKKMDSETGMPEGTIAKAEGTNEEKVEKSAAPEFTEELAKSYIDARISPIESKLDQITSVLEKLADAPVPAKSASYKSVVPLAKSEAAVEPLNKAQVVEKLFELKKSGTNVDSSDIAKAELSDQNQLSALAEKYNLGV